MSCDTDILVASYHPILRPPVARLLSKTGEREPSQANSRRQERVEAPRIAGKSAPGLFVGEGSTPGASTSDV